MEPDQAEVRSGLDALIACYVTLTGPVGLDLVDRLFLARQGREVPFAETYAAVMAVRFLGEDFIASYFDTGYDLYRQEKYTHVKNEDIESYIGWLGSLGFSFLDDALVFNATVDGPIVKPNTGDYFDWPHLYAVLILGEGIVPNVSFEAALDKRSLFDTSVDFKNDLVIAARINYSIGAAVLSFVYQISRDSIGNGDSKSGIESSIQLF